ncbi:putative serine/threonine-protein kinase-like protein CCR3 [Telopea speciosissima]|uniref:putative serine/threonine-protein kinase-like protein CCR3 n=1 Tax=Telopea speciosissima TaxID=54955 RepID=UPI001CC45E38|nr:putative serine/threonine-protein kinase-like protein CCR3 [Telopea speciosissima]
MCWGLAGNSFPSPSQDENFLSITSGEGFSCGILSSNSRVRCWGSDNPSATDLEYQFKDFSMYSLVAGNSHVCGYNMDGYLICRGRNDTGQLGNPDRFSKPFEFSVLALGIIHSCGIRLWDKEVVCWGGKGEFSSNVTKGISFETIVAGTGYTCGVVSNGFNLICWGAVWNNEKVYVPNFPRIAPSPCVLDNCPCKPYANSGNICMSGLTMCMRCCPKIYICF